MRKSIQSLWAKCPNCQKRFPAYESESSALNNFLSFASLFMFCLDPLILLILPFFLFTDIGPFTCKRCGQIW
jgi:endogenous inhibitor of DNA gyrase (YacG/DUF329 family)